MKKNRLKVMSEQPAGSLAQVLRNNIEEIGFGVFCAVAVLAITLIPTEENVKNTTNTPTNPSHTTEDESNTLSLYAPVGYHYEGDVIVKNPEGLVRANHTPEARYHLEAFEYDESLFYVVEDGYHMENGQKVKDGYHIENGEIVKDVTLSFTPSTKKED